MRKWIINVALFLMILGIIVDLKIDTEEIVTREVNVEKLKANERQMAGDAICMVSMYQEQGVHTYGQQKENNVQTMSVYTRQSEQQILAEESAEKAKILEGPPEVEITEEGTAGEELPEVEITEEDTTTQETVDKYAQRHTDVLTARKGYITNSPCGPNGNDGYETWYPTFPGGAVKILERECGFTNLEISVCNEEGPRKGVRILSGTMPNGDTFENLVVVAADIVCPRNPNGAFERGQIIETSLGTGIIVDFCERAVNERIYNNRTHIDIATAWS